MWGPERWPGPSASQRQETECWVDGTPRVCGQRWRERTDGRSRACFPSLLQPRFFHEVGPGEAQVGRKKGHYLAVAFQFQMISARRALETRSACLPKPARPQPSPGRRGRW